MSLYGKSQVLLIKGTICAGKCRMRLRHWCPRALRVCFGYAVTRPLCEHEKSSENLTGARSSVTRYLLSLWGGIQSEPALVKWSDVFGILWCLRQVDRPPSLTLDLIQSTLLIGENLDHRFVFPRTHSVSTLDSIRKKKTIWRGSEW